MGVITRNRVPIFDGLKNVTGNLFIPFKNMKISIANGEDSNAIIIPTLKNVLDTINELKNVAFDTKYYLEIQIPYLPTSQELNNNYNGGTLVVKELATNINIILGVNSPQVQAEINDGILVVDSKGNFEVAGLTPAGWIISDQKNTIQELVQQVQASLINQNRKITDLETIQNQLLFANANNLTKANDKDIQDLGSDLTINGERIATRKNVNDKISEVKNDIQIIGDNSDAALSAATHANQIINATLPTIEDYAESKPTFVRLGDLTQTIIITYSPSKIFTLNGNNAVANLTGENFSGFGIGDDIRHRIFDLTGNQIAILEDSWNDGKLTTSNNLIYGKNVSVLSTPTSLTIDLQNLTAAQRNQFISEARLAQSTDPKGAGVGGVDTIARADAATAKVRADAAFTLAGGANSLASSLTQLVNDKQDQIVPTSRRGTTFLEGQVDAINVAVQDIEGSAMVKGDGSIQRLDDANPAASNPVDGNTIVSSKAYVDAKVTPAILVEDLATKWFPNGIIISGNNDISSMKENGLVDTKLIAPTGTAPTIPESSRVVYLQESGGAFEPLIGAIGATNGIFYDTLLSGSNESLKTIIGTNSRLELKKVPATFKPQGNEVWNWLVVKVVSNALVQTGPVWKDITATYKTRNWDDVDLGKKVKITVGSSTYILTYSLNEKGFLGEKSISLCSVIVNNGGSVVIQWKTYEIGTNFLVGAQTILRTSGNHTTGSGIRTPIVKFEIYE